MGNININFNRLGEKFTAVPVFYPPKFQKWDDNRKDEGRTTKRKTIRERIWILSLAVSFSIQYADFVKIYALDKHSILFYISTFDLFATFYRLFSKIFKEIISKPPLFFKIRLFWWKYEYALGYVGVFWHGAYIIHASLEIPKVSLAYWCEIFFEVYDYFMFLRCFSKMVHTTDKRTDVWSRDFIIWKINSGLWAVVWAGLWNKRVWADYEQLLRPVF